MSQFLVWISLSSGAVIGEIMSGRLGIHFTGHYTVNMALFGGAALSTHWLVNRFWTR